jgi:hypothetical protein
LEKRNEPRLFRLFHGIEKSFFVLPDNHPLVCVTSALRLISLSGAALA